MRKKYNYMLREGGARRGSEGLVGLGLYLEARVSIDPYLEARLNIKPAAARQVRSGDNTCRADGLNAPLGVDCPVSSRSVANTATSRRTT
jgi:hypothetical protein